MSEERLTAAEELAFAGLARAMIRMDGHFTAEEADALLPLMRAVLAFPESDKVDGDAPLSAEERERCLTLLDRSETELQDERAVRDAARGVTRQPVRELFYQALFELAAVDMVSTAEQSLLTWLREHWGVSA